MKLKCVYSQYTETPLIDYLSKMYTFELESNENHLYIFPHEHDHFYYRLV